MLVSLTPPISTFARTGGMFDQITKCDAIRGGVREQPANKVKPVIARKNLFPLLAPLAVHFLHDLGVILDNVR